MIMDKETLSHPTIGKVKGNATKDGVIEFLGLQYATLTDRFAPAKIKEYSKQNTIDATKIG